MKTNKAFERVWVRKTIYRNQNGFLVGSGRGIFGTRIFVRTKEKAEVIREKVKAGREVTLEDLQCK